MNGAWNLETFDESEIKTVEVLLQSLDCGTEYSVRSQFPSVNQLPDTEIALWWTEITGGILLETIALEYFQEAFKCAPDKLALKFSCDGIAVIPNIFPQLSRIEALENVRKMFDRYTHQSNFNDKQLAYDPLNADDRHIVEYIGGYIIQRLMRKSLEMDCKILEKFTDDTASPDGSLISVYKNEEFGSLTTPSKDLTNFLTHLELAFREHYSVENTAQTVLNRLDAAYLIQHFQHLKMDDKAFVLISKIILYYINIRCYQKAKSLKLKLKVQTGQNISTRKKLK